MSSLVNKAKDMLHGDKHDDKHTTTGAHHTTTGTTGTTGTTSVAGTTGAAGVGSHTGMSTKSTTQTHETIAPAVVQEQVAKQVTEELNVVEDREHHVHHHQQRVQPVADRVEQETQHKHTVLPVETRERTHEMSDGAKRALAEQQNAYQNTSTTLPTQYSKVQGAVTGQDVTHHHVHETVQPVIQREVLQKEHIHVTAPVHEVVHEKPVVHEATIEPTISMAEFSKAGGSLTGGKTVEREVRPGEPQTLEGSHLSGHNKHTDAIGTAGHGVVGSTHESHHKH